MRHFDPARLHGAVARLGEAAVDPMLWPDVMQDISSAVGSIGAALLQSDVRTPDIPRTEGVKDAFYTYFAEDWHTRDLRAYRTVPLLLQGANVLIDQDIMTPDEVRRSDYYNFLQGVGLSWFAVVGFRAGKSLWGLCIQRTVHEGPFDNELKAALGGLSARLSEVANLSQAVGRAALSGMTNALNLVKQPAMAVDSRGYVLDVNAAAEQLFDAELSVRKRRLIVRDRSAKLQLDALADQLRAATDTAPLLAMPIVVRRRLKQPLVIRVIPIPASSRSPFLGARVLLVFSDLNRAPTAQGDLIRTTFGDSQPAEVRLAVIMTDGVFAR